jgi:hypothetical protein
MCETINDVPRRKTILEKMGLKREEEPLTCERCAYETLNGEDSFRSLPERIRKKQASITSTIKSKYAVVAQNGVVEKQAEFNCVVTIEEDLSRYVEEVFKPFIDGGFEIINISKACEDIHEDNVFFISWRRAFQDVEKIVKL